MARGKASAGSKSAVFRRLFNDHKDLLKVSSTAEILDLYTKESGSPISQSDRQVAANVKSKMRKELGMRGRRRGKRKAGRPVASEATTMTSVGRPASAILALEDSLDDCIYAARRANNGKLDDVVKLLRRARKRLILLNGE